jgi:hypothetical protein
MSRKFIDFLSSIFIELIKIINTDDSGMSSTRIDFIVPALLLPEWGFTS